MSTSLPAQAAGNLPTALINQQQGSAVDLNTFTTWPANPAGGGVNLQLTSVKDNTGATVDASTNLQATWCANMSGTTPLVGADVGSLAGVSDNCAPLSGAAGAPLSVNVTAGNVTVTGNLGGLPAGKTCQRDNTVIPCLLILANVTQTAAFAVPIANITTAQVAGPLAPPAFSDLIADCTGRPAITAPAKSCPSTRPGAPTAFGGIGFIPSANNLSPTDPTTWLPGNSVTDVQVSLCTTATGTGCSSAALVKVAGGGTIWGGVIADGSLSGAFVYAGATPGAYFLQIKATNIVAAASAGPGFTEVPGTGGGLYSFTQTQYAPLQILGAGSATKSALTGGVAAQTTLTVTGLNPNTTGTVKLKDTNGLQMGADISILADGIGRSVTTLDVPYPTASIVVAGTSGAAAYTQTLTVDQTEGIGTCAGAPEDGDGCTAALIVTAAVLPGSLAIFMEEAAVEVPAPDLSLIDLSDPDTWYQVSEPGTPDSGEQGQLVVGDFTGSNAGFVVTANTQDLTGSAQRSNLILAQDVWIVPTDCAASEADGLFGIEQLGEPVLGDEPEPIGDEDSNPAVEDGAEICSVNADANGRAAGIFNLTFDVLVAARPTTAADDYTGLITVTIVSQ
ncbi:MAG: hypothetical protein ACOYL9_05070 [Ilumatobacteraceae bacterium]